MIPLDDKKPSLEDVLRMAMDLKSQLSHLVDTLKECSKGSDEEEYEEEEEETEEADDYDGEAVEESDDAESDAEAPSGRLSAIVTALKNKKK